MTQIPHWWCYWTWIENAILTHVSIDVQPLELDQLQRANPELAAARNRTPGRHITRGVSIYAVKHVNRDLPIRVFDSFSRRLHQIGILVTSV